MIIGSDRFANFNKARDIPRISLQRRLTSCFGRTLGRR